MKLTGRVEMKESAECSIMTVAKPPTDIPIDPHDVDGQVDELYFVFFSTNSWIAVLACDAAGTNPDELLYRSRDAWSATVRKAASLRPVAKIVDLELLALLKFNLCERDRQKLFHRLFQIRRDLCKSDSRQNLEKRADALEIQDVVHSKIENTAQFFQDLPPVDCKRQIEFAHLPHLAPMLKRVNDRTLAKEEAVLISALEALTRYAHNHVAAERTVFERPEAKPSIVPQPPRPPLTARGRFRSADTSRPEEKELAALVRMTMAKISENALADQKTSLLLNEKTPSELARAHSERRRLASSPSAHSVTSHRQFVAPRPSFDGLPSVDLARYRREREFTDLKSRAQSYEQQAETREMRVDRQKEIGVFNAVLSGQAHSARQILCRQNKQRAQKQAEAHRQAIVSAREQKRSKAVEVTALRRETAATQRMSHLEMAALRKRFAGAMESMAIRSQWDVPDDLRGLMDARGGNV